MEKVSKAYFKFDDPDKKRTSVLGEIKLKHDGSYSVSISNARRISSFMNSRARNLANEIIEKRFEHPSVTFLERQNSKLIDVLREHTTELKIEFLERTKEWSTKQYQHSLEMNKRTSEEWYIEYGMKFNEKIHSFTKERMVILDMNDKKTREWYPTMRKEVMMHKDRTKVSLEKYLAIKEQKAIAHYESSLMKLSDRLSKKGIFHDSGLVIEQSKIGVNLEMLIKHNDTVTKAWTIWASGEIQEPHYRYLVK